MVMRTISKNFNKDFSKIEFSTTSDFESFADTFLESLEENLETLEQSEVLQDIHYSQGVLTIDMGIEGVWVINKQSPNKQLWFSSPKSGPMRFYLDGMDGKWRCTKDKGELICILNRELSSVAGIHIALE